MRSLLERLVFPYLTYTPVPMSLRNPRVPVGLVFTMGAPEEGFTGELTIFKNSLEAARLMLGFVYGRIEMLCSYDTLQFDDYSKYEASRFDPEAKAKRHAEVFPEDCARARELGGRLMGEA